MSKRKNDIVISAKMNPFSKKNPAASMFFPTEVIVEQKNNIDEHEQENQNELNVNHVNSVQEISTELFEHDKQENNINGLVMEDTEQPPKKKRGRKKKYTEPREHLHLILPSDQVQMIKQLAKIAGTSTNEFMIDTINAWYETQWKNVVDTMNQNRHKLGLDVKISKKLFQ